MASLLVFVFIIAFFSVKIPKSWNGGKSIRAKPWMTKVVNSAYEIKMAVRMPLRFFNAYVVKGGTTVGEASSILLNSIGLVLSLCIFSLVFTIASLCYPVAVFKHSKGWLLLLAYFASFKVWCCLTIAGVSKLSNLTRSLVVVTACTFVFGNGNCFLIPCNIAQVRPSIPYAPLTMNLVNSFHLCFFRLIQSLTDFQ